MAHKKFFSPNPFFICQMSLPLPVFSRMLDASGQLVAYSMKPCSLLYRLS
jgi:hypothetical protein